MGELQHLNVEESESSYADKIKNRSCTDIICAVIFFICLIALLVTAVIAYIYGDPMLLIYPQDSNNDLCGYGKYSDKKYLYFYNLFLCAQAGPGVFVRGCPTTQVCVKKCPTEFKALFIPNVKASCPSDFCTSNSSGDCLQRINEYKCPPFLIKSSPVLNRCVPGEFDIKGAAEIFDNKGKSVITRTKLGEKTYNRTKMVMEQFLRLKALSDDIISDVIKARFMIMICFCIAAVLSFIWILLMRCIALPLIVISMVFFVAVFGFAAGWSFYMLSQEKKGENFNMYLAVMNFEFSKSKTWLALGLIFTGLFVIVLLISIFLRKRIRLAVALLHEGSRAISRMMFSLLWPVVPFILQFGVIALWLSIAIHLASLRGGKNVEDMNSHNISQVMLSASKNSIHAVDCQSPAAGKICGFIKFNTAKYSFYLQILNLVMFYWMITFIIALGHMTLAGAFANYYWAADKKSDVTSFPILESFGQCLRYHIGTLAFGSLIITIMKIFRLTLEYIHDKLKESGNKCAEYCLKCCVCCVWCLEKILKLLTENAYIMTAIHGTNFCTSAKNYASLIASNIIRVVVIDRVTDFFLFVGKLLITGIITVAAFYFFKGEMAGVEHLTPKLSYYLAPVIIVAIGTYVISALFFSVYEMAINTLFLCFLEDLKKNEGSSELPHMSASLYSLLAKS